MQFLLTLFVGAAAGFLFLKGKIPGGMMVGALVGAVILNIGTDLAYMPSTARNASGMHRRRLAESSSVRSNHWAEAVRAAFCTSQIT